jgi:uncharacterized protein YprB with RNaseH-like and TPR domain
MISLTDRLRGVVRPAGSVPIRSGVSADDSQSADSADSAAALLGGEWKDADGHRYLVVDHAYAPGHRHGSMSVADGLPPREGWPQLALLGGSSCGGNLLFVDLETTGLAGGAGTYAFLVGCAWFSGGRFRTRQFFLSSFSAERALLEAVGEVAGSAATVVTYNGKTFDLPLMETRYALNRMQTPFASIPHVDMLHPARRLWRGPDDLRGGDESARTHSAMGSPGATTGCRLSTLEQSLLGHEREGDVPGFEIPARYFRYVHGNDARLLGPVFEHNRLDLLSLALLTARAALLLDEGATGAVTAREAFGLGRLYERAGMNPDALASFTRAYEMGSAVQVEALRARALLLRRLRRYEDAAETWQRLLDLRSCPPGVAREATEALAVHYEHRLRNLPSARCFALRSLELDAGHARRNAAEHRLARLDRKLGRSSSAPLF